MTRTALRLAAVLTFALCTSACSSLDDAFSSVMGDDAPANGGGQQASTDQNGFPVDNTPAQTADNSAGGALSAGTGATPVAPPPAQTADANTLPPMPAQPAAAPPPDLAAIPDKPSGTTTPDQQKEVADSLAADRARANYSSEALRGGTEAAAAPPGPAPAPGTEVADAGAPPASATPAQPAPAAPPPSDSTAPAPSSDAGTPPPAATDSGAAPSAAPAGPVASAPEPAPAAGTAVASAPLSSTPMAPPPGAQPAVPADGVPGAQPMMTADAQLGFKPSTAPALDSNISQFVPQPIIQRYQQTAANAGIATGPVAPSNQMAAVAPRIKHGRAVGGPEQMSGSVVANLDVLNSPNAGTPSVYANAAGLPPAAVVMFPGDGTKLSAAGREQIRAAVAEFQNRGGTGFIKVVGHSSSRTSNMPVEKHLIAIFEKSQQRANAVAAEIIREGVPASRVLVEAVGDSQPVYYESMPQGEEGNRRAEIFFQG
jgi:outer membrane protein OmpA-like peptidoglycan-associated protein